MAQVRIKYDERGNPIPKNPAGVGLARYFKEPKATNTGVKRDSDRNPKSTTAKANHAQRANDSVPATILYGASAKRQKVGGGFQPRNNLQSRPDRKGTVWAKGLTAKPGIKTNINNLSSAPSFDSSSFKSKEVCTRSPKPLSNEANSGNSKAALKSAGDNSNPVNIDLSSPKPVFKNFKLRNNNSNAKSKSQADSSKASNWCGNSDYVSKKIDLSNNSALRQSGSYTSPKANSSTITSAPQHVVYSSKYLGRLERAVDTRRKTAEEERSKLPIRGYRADIRWALRKKDVLLLIAETGSGKSTQVPRFLCDEPWCKKKTFKVRGHREVVGGVIAITQPRKLPALTLARRVAEEMGFPSRLVGTDKGIHQTFCDVGYSVRFDKWTPPKMRIKFLTEGMLLRELLVDPDLKQYSAVLVDEIHERTMNVDLLTGFLKKIVTGDKNGRHGVPLKVVIMSATTNMTIFRDFFNAKCDIRRSSASSVSTYSSWEGCSDGVKPDGENETTTWRNSNSTATFNGPVSVAATKDGSIVEEVRVPGRQHEVTFFNTPGPVTDYFDAMVRTIHKIHTTKAYPGDILCFLPGQSEIESVRQLITAKMPDFDGKIVPRMEVLTLYGQMDVAQQKAVFDPLPTKRTRKIILSTNIAETSVTIPGIKYVVDSGKAKIKEHRHRVGIDSLLVKPISKSSAKQRAGRAGRESAGECYRLYSEGQYLKLAESDVPEILRTDIITAVLSMKARGVKDPLAFPLIDPPERDAVVKALIQLLRLGAISTDNSITEVGKKIARFPLSPTHGRILVAAAPEGYDCIFEAIDVLACLNTEGEIFRQPTSEKQREETQSARDSLTRREGDILTLLTTIQRCLSEAPPGERSTWCEQHQINWSSMKYAIQIRDQLQRTCVHEGLLQEKQKDLTEFEPITEEKGEALLKCFLKAFADKTAVLHPDKSYRTTGTRDVIAIHPGSVMHGRKCEAIMYLEPVYTSKYFAKKVSMVQIDWVMEALAAQQT